jgi:hypothetical protein
LTAARAVFFDPWAIRPNQIEETSMNSLSFASHANAFSPILSMQSLRDQVPAVFATSAHEDLTPRYTFIPTSRVLDGLMQAGFVPVEARQSRPRRASALHARHVVRLRRRFETVLLRDQSIPEVVFWNSHDGSSTYALRLGIFRVICENGLLASRGAFPAYCIPHRGNVMEDVVTGALKLAEEFDGLAARVEQMEGRKLGKDEQLAFADKALALTFRDATERHMSAAQLLTCRRTEDLGDDLWTVTNRIQESVVRGGMTRRTASGRLTRTRGIRAIREEIRVNAGIWDLAEQILAA